MLVKALLFTVILHISHCERIRRNIFGTDDRIYIPNDYLERFPFESVVRITGGCSGTLVWYQHVLTSAHCVHDHLDFKKNLEVSVKDRYGQFRWYQVKEMHVPTVWKKTITTKYLKNDYAIIKLNKPHRRRWVDFGSDEISKGAIIQFTGYSEQKLSDSKMTSSVCLVRQASKHFIFNYCDATEGMSGSGVYTYGASKKRRVVGVFSSYIQMGKSGMNVAIRLTQKKIRKICQWMNAGLDCRRMNRGNLNVVEM